MNGYPEQTNRRLARIASNIRKRKPKQLNNQLTKGDKIMGNRATVIFTDGKKEIGAAVYLHLLTGKNIIRLTLTCLLLRTLFLPAGNQVSEGTFFLLTFPSSMFGLLSFWPLVLEYLIIILIGLILYTFKRD